MAGQSSPCTEFCILGPTASLRGYLPAAECVPGPSGCRQRCGALGSVRDRRRVHAAAVGVQRQSVLRRCPLRCQGCVAIFASQSSPCIEFCIFSPAASPRGYLPFPEGIPVTGGRGQGISTINRVRNRRRVHAAAIGVQRQGVRCHVPLGCQGGIAVFTLQAGFRVVRFIGPVAARCSNLPAAECVPGPSRCRQRCGTLDRIAVPALAQSGSGGNAAAIGVQRQSVLCRCPVGFEDSVAGDRIGTGKRCRIIAHSPAGKCITILGNVSICGQADRFADLCNARGS